MCLYEWVGRCKCEKLPKDGWDGADCESLSGHNNPALHENDEVKPDIVNPDADVSNISSDSWLVEEASSIHELDSKFEKIALEDPTDVEVPEKGLFNFWDCHPLYKTHGTRCVAEEKALIPNFVGATLPRCDQGDREYYCSAMMALFKPWRSGHDLKSSDQSWDDVFLLHNFTTRQKELMANFNIKYECLDSRDDFHAQFQKGSAILPSWIKEDDVAEWSKLDNDDGDIMPLQSQEEYDPEPGIIGKRENKRRQDMSAMCNIMTQAGWTDVVMNKDHETTQFNMSPPEKIQSSSQWKADVQKKRQEILDIRAQHAPTSSESDSGPKHGFDDPNKVEVVDKSYLERAATGHSSTDSRTLVDTIVAEFRLNCEQERAFCIIANHACTPHSEQLKMYIGGMGGTGKTQVLKALISFFTARNESH